MNGVVGSVRVEFGDEDELCDRRKESRITKRMHSECEWG